MSYKIDIGTDDAKLRTIPSIPCRTRSRIAGFELLVLLTCERMDSCENLELWISDNLSLVGF